MSWGPSHQQPEDRARLKRWVIGAVTFFVILVALDHASRDALGLAELVLVGFVIWKLFRILRRRVPRPAEMVGRAIPTRRPPTTTRSSLPVLSPHGGGVYLGVDLNGRPLFSRSERAVLVLGPPRSGKTTAVIIPTILTHPGAVVSTSTKPDVMSATAGARSQRGQTWLFDPTGTADPEPGVEVLRWSPVLCAHDWDAALLMARAMVSGTRVGTGTTDQSHWSRRAEALLAPLLHAAAIGGGDISSVLDWVSAHEVDEPGLLLEREDRGRLAAGALLGLRNTEQRERSSIFSAAADALDAYRSQAAVDSATNPNFYAGRFVRSADAIYIHAPAENQHLAAPLVCGLLSEIRRATYQAHKAGVLTGLVLFALDEVANIAPLDELPQIASEGGGQGLLLLAALQDLSQARARWGAAADGFLTLFGTKLILPGIADHKTLETVSVTLGEYDRKVVAQTRTRNPTSFRTQRGNTVSTQRTRVLSPGEIANIPAGQALHLDGVSWELVYLTPAHTHQPWVSHTGTGR
jgi:type IV secretion system protein VirD4